MTCRHTGHIIKYLKEENVKLRAQLANLLTILLPC